MVKLIFEAKTKKGEEVITMLAGEKMSGLTKKDKFALKVMTKRKIIVKDPLTLEFKINIGKVILDNESISKGVIQLFEEQGAKKTDYKLVIE